VSWGKQQAGLDASVPVDVTLLGDPLCPPDARGCVNTRLSSSFIVLSDPGAALHVVDLEAR
jgi:hypothetical protein